MRIHKIYIAIGSDSQDLLLCIAQTISGANKAVKPKWISAQQPEIDAGVFA